MKDETTLLPIWDKILDSPHSFGAEYSPKYKTLVVETIEHPNLKALRKRIQEAIKEEFDMIVYDLSWITFVRVTQKGPKLIL